MSGSERDTCVRGTCNQKDRRRRIRELNDELRCYGRDGIICITAGVQALGQESVEAALIGTRNFAAFTSGNDPYDEHDFGVFKAGGRRIFWKIDYYDRERRFGSSDPANPAVTTRVLTIMLASEY